MVCPVAVGVRWEPVDLAELGRRVALGDRAWVGDPGAGLRPVVQAEHGGDHAVPLGRNAQLARAVPVGDPSGGLTWLSEVPNSPASRSAPPRSRTCRVAASADTTWAPRRAASGRDQFQVGGVGAVPLGELRHGDRRAAGRRGQRCPAAQHHRHLDLGVRRERRGGLRPGRHRLARAATEGYRPRALAAPTPPPCSVYAALHLSARERLSSPPQACSMAGA